MPAEGKKKGKGMKRIGILGGTFDPIHIGHIMLAETAYHEFHLDKVLIMPSNMPPHKKEKVIADTTDRMEMIRLAISGRQYLELSDIEISRAGETFTSDTLEELTELNPDTKYFFILGGDALSSFPKWHNADSILKHCALIAAPRADFDLVTVRHDIRTIRRKFSEDGFIPEIYYMAGPIMNISSRQIRNLVSYNMPVSAYMPHLVAEFIDYKGIYLSEQYEAIKADLKSKLKPSRYEHTINVAQTAVWLSMSHGIDTDKAYLSGLLHDCAKYLSDEEMIAAAGDNNIELEPVELKSVQLIHSKLGAVFAKTVYGVEDEDILNSIRSHTTGRPGMTDLEKIIYLADAIEPSRCWDEVWLERMRAISSADLDYAMFCILDRTLEHLRQNYADNISNVTRDTLEYFRGLVG